MDPLLPAGRGGIGSTLANADNALKNAASNSQLQNRAENPRPDMHKSWKLIIITNSHFIKLSLTLLYFCCLYC